MFEYSNVNGIRVSFLCVFIHSIQISMEFSKHISSSIIRIIKQFIIERKVNYITSSLLFIIFSGPTVMAIHHVVITLTVYALMICTVETSFQKGI